MIKYKALKQQVFSDGLYSIEPIRIEDKGIIMKWRNEQMYHLRQSKPLTEEAQEQYFKTVISKLFGQERPEQLLFSYLEDGVCIGYGGLVHINWIDHNAEISFIIDTHLEPHSFHKHWNIYLRLIEKVAFQELNMHKIFVYAFDLRPHLYKALETSGYYREATLAEHCFYVDRYIDVVIYSKINGCD